MIWCDKINSSNMNCLVGENYEKVLFKKTKY